MRTTSMTLGAALGFALTLTPATGSASEYPTLETVDHVLTCMRLNGGQSVENLYACSCEIDFISQKMSFEDFSEANTYRIYKRMPGEKGGLFRDNERADVLLNQLEALKAEAEKRCFLGVRRQAGKAHAGKKVQGSPNVDEAAATKNDE